MTSQKSVSFLVVLCFSIVQLQANEGWRTYSLTVRSSGNVLLEIYSGINRISFNLQLSTDNTTNVLLDFSSHNKTLIVQVNNNESKELHHTEIDDISIRLTSPNNDTIQYNSDTMRNDTKLRIFCKPLCTNFTTNVTAGNATDSIRKPFLTQKHKKVVTTDSSKLEMVTFEETNFALNIIWTTLNAMVSVVLLGLLGSWLWIRRRRRKNQKQDISDENYSFMDSNINVQS